MLPLVVHQNKSLNHEPAAHRARELLRATMQADGICVCFACSVPVLTQRYMTRHAGPQRPATERYDLAPSGASRGVERARRRERRYTPGDPREATAARKHNASQVEGFRRAAVTAELRAIGIEPDLANCLLKRVPAKEALRLTRFKGGSDLVGETFDARGAQWVVQDVAPSTIQPDARFVVYALNVAVRIRRGNASLPDVCEEFEVADARAAIRAAAAQAAPAAEAGDEQVPRRPPQLRPATAADDFGEPMAAPVEQQAADFLNEVAPPGSLGDFGVNCAPYDDDDDEHMLDDEPCRLVGSSPPLPPQQQQPRSPQQSPLPPPPVHSPSDLLDDLLDMADAADWLPPPEQSQAKQRLEGDSDDAAGNSKHRRVGGDAADASHDGVVAAILAEDDDGLEQLELSYMHADADRGSAAELPASLLSSDSDVVLLPARRPRVSWKPSSVVEELRPTVYPARRSFGAGGPTRRRQYGGEQLDKQHCA